MLKFLESRHRSGHTDDGRPPVAVFYLCRRDERPQCDLQDTLQKLANTGLPIDRIEWAHDDSPGLWAKAFGLMVAELLRQGGHEPGTPHVSRHGDHYTVTLPCEEPQTALEAAELAADWLPATDASPSLDNLDEFLDKARERMPNPDARIVLKAAHTCGLPALRLDQDPFESAPPDSPIRFGLIQLGHGNCSRVLAGAMPDGLPQDTLLQLADRHRLISRLLENDIPVPRQDLEFPNKNRANRCAQSALRLGFPVTLRPQFRTPFAAVLLGESIFGPLESRTQVERAYVAASRESRRVSVEEFVPGNRLRCLIIGKQVRALTHCVPPFVMGDGQRTIDALIAERTRLARHPLAGAAWKALAQGDGDLDARLAIAGVNRNTVLSEGQQMTLRGQGTAYNGGVCKNVDQSISSDIRALAERAAALCGIREFGAVDLAIIDMRGPAEPPNCHVLDVLPDPDLLTHQPDGDPDSPALADALVAHLFPPNRPARIPTVAITGTNGKTTTSRMTARVFRRQYQVAGLATTEGAYINDECLLEGDVAGITGAAMVLADKRARAAVLETARGGLYKSGTAFDEVDAAVCLNVAADHIGVDGIETIEQLAEIKSRLLERARRRVVINADDRLCLSLLEKPGLAPAILVTRDPERPVIADHLARQGQAVILCTIGESEWIVLAEGHRYTPLIETLDIPAVMNGLLPFNAFNAAAAAALCWAVGISRETIAASLAEFSNSPQCNPGRYNFIAGHPFTVLTDFAQNPHGVAGLLQVTDRIQTKGRSRLVCMTIGPRHRSHIDETAGWLAGRFDQFILGCSEYADDNPEYSGNNPRENMLKYFRQRLRAEDVSDERIDTFIDREAAVQHGLACSQPGDLLIILGPPDLVLPIVQPRTEQDAKQ